MLVTYACAPVAKAPDTNAATAKAASEKRFCTSKNVPQIARNPAPISCGPPRQALGMRGSVPPGFLAKSTASQNPAIVQSAPTTRALREARLGAGAAVEATAVSLAGCIPQV